MKGVFSVLVVLGFGFTLGSAGCSDLNNCPTDGSGGAAGSSCVAGNPAAGTAGASGSSATTTCPQLTALQACLKPFCQTDGAGTPFCKCFLLGYDLGPAPDCGCIAFDTAEFCAEATANQEDASAFDCSAASGSVASLCVDVQ